jgi:hypothetical protein
LALEGDAVEDFEGLTFADLTEDQRKAFFKYKFIIRELPAIEDVEIRAIFTRINRNVMNLNKQELRHATYWGPFIKLMEELGKGTNRTELNIFTPKDVRRMLDIEFISELAVAYLHGIQNKKDALEDWYKTYETGFEDGESVKRRFSLVLEEIRALLGDSSTRFRKKSDFYTLFLVLADDDVELPLSSDKRLSVRSTLLQFGSHVDAFIKAPPNTQPATENVGKYARAVQKAASDRSTRRARAEALTQELALKASN